MAGREHAMVPVSIRSQGEELCLAYANTLSWRGAPTPTETLAGLPDLLHWLTAIAAWQQAVLTETAAWSQQHPKRAARLFTEALDLRETIHRSFFAIASGDAVPEADLAALNAALSDAPQRARLVRQGDTYAWAVGPSSPSAPVLLAPVLWSAADLLARAGLRRVRRCANDQCLWLFTDESKGGTRRWCDMSACGNRAKSQRHYRRSRPA